MEGEVISKVRSSTGRSFQAVGPTTEKALRCIIAKRARGIKSSPLAADLLASVEMRMIQCRPTEPTERYKKTFDDYSIIHCSDFHSVIITTKKA